MADFSVRALISPVIPHVNYCFDRASLYIASKHTSLSLNDINHDIKALMFNATSIMIITAAALAYFRVIYVITATAVITAFYLSRRVIDETLHPMTPEKKEQKGWGLRDLFNWTQTTTGVLPGTPAQPAKPWTAYLYRDNTICIGTVSLWIFTKIPLTTLVGLTQEK